MSSDCGQRACKPLALLASYLESAQFELQILLFVEQLLQSVSQDDVCVVEAAVLLVELVVLIIFDAGGHAVVRHGRILLILIASSVDEAASGVRARISHGTGICRASLHPTAK